MLDILARWNRWGGATLAGGISRDIVPTLQPFLNSNDVIVLIGPRRAGKTTVLFQLMDVLLAAGTKPEAMLHINFEEPAFAPELSIKLLDDMYNSYRQNVYPDGKAYLFLDEIQNVPQWERWVRARNETENIKIFLTGSSSRLMSRELGTLLTGRHLSFKVFPLSFKEFLRFNKIEMPHLFEINPKIQFGLNQYLQWGGFPEVVLSNDEVRKELLLKQYFDDILFKDVAMRHSVRDIGTLRNLAVHLLTQTGNLTSYQRIAKLFGVSLDLAQSYCHYLQEAFLINFVSFYSQKVSERNRNPHKVYALDLGLRYVVGLAHSADRGRLIETAVYQALIQKKNDGVFYWKKEQEIDFAIRQGNIITTLLQVADGDEKVVENLPREIKAFLTAGKKFSKANKIIIAGQALRAAYAETEKNISVIPLWKFLLD